MSLFLAVILLLSVSTVAFAAEDTYTVTYVADGEVVSTQEVAQGKDAVAPEIPGKFGYNQIAPQWDKDGKNITEDTTITAVYTVNQYEVTYKVDGDVYKRLTYLHGEKVPMIPTLFPAERKIEASRYEVVVFPFVPVIPTIRRREEGLP